MKMKKHALAAGLAGGLLASGAFADRLIDPQPSAAAGMFLGMPNPGPSSESCSHPGGWLDVRCSGTPDFLPWRRAVPFGVPTRLRNWLSAL